MSDDNKNEFGISKPIPYSTDFQGALTALKDGHAVTRSGWNGQGQFLTLQTPTDTSKMTLPYIFITTVSGAKVPWVASHTDLLADDWKAADQSAAK